MPGKVSRIIKIGTAVQKVAEKIVPVQPVNDPLVIGPGGCIMRKSMADAWDFDGFYS